MKRIATGLALAAALLGSTVAGTALAQSYNPQRGQDDSWRQRNARTSIEGRWVADNRSTDTGRDRGDFRGRAGMGGTILPEFIRIDQQPSLVRISDRRNHTLQEILVGGRFGQRVRPDADLLGHWRGTTLVVEQTGRRGATITQSFSLEDRGRKLVVHTRREGRGPRGTMEFSTIYRRA